MSELVEVSRDFEGALLALDALRAEEILRTAAELHSPMALVECGGPEP